MLDRTENNMETLREKAKWSVNRFSHTQEKGKFSRRPEGKDEACPPSPPPPPPFFFVLELPKLDLGTNKNRPQDSSM